MLFSDINFSWSDLMGLIGVVLYVGSYFALQAGIIKGQGYLYAGLNAGAGSCVLLSLVESFNLSSAIIQVTYIVISIFGIIRFYLLTHRIDFSDEERAFLNVAAPNLNKLHARQLLDLGTWETVLDDVVLTTESEKISHLYFIQDGTAGVSVAGNTVASLGAGSLIGEISMLTGMPASATVRTTKPSHVFSIDVSVLEKFLVRNQPVRHELESRFANQIGEKLVRANTTLLGQIDTAQPDSSHTP